jgi:hypothetical protein
MAPENARRWRFMAPEKAISWQFMASESAGYWRFMALSNFCEFLMIPLSLANYVIHAFYS